LAFDKCKRQGIATRHRKFNHLISIRCYFAVGGVRLPGRDHYGRHGPKGPLVGRKYEAQPKLTELMRLAFKRNKIKVLYNVNVVYIAKNIAVSDKD
jgi:hypothetical protein